MRVVLFLVSLLVSVSSYAAESAQRVPKLVGKPWIVAGSPDLGKYTGDNQQPVDFGVWQAADGTWQLWSCIRNAKLPGRTRLFHRWEGQSLTDSDWKPMGIAMMADSQYGEDENGLQAPFVFKRNGEYLMFYGDWNRICLATSSDGKAFTRKLDENGQPALFVDDETFINCRDAMVLKIGELWHCYYCVSHAGRKGKIYCRTSPDLKQWSEPLKVSAGSECPFVVERSPNEFYLFRTHRYGLRPFSRVVASSDPLDFGVEDDRKVITTLKVAAPEIVHHEGQYYIAYLRPELDGIQISRLDWSPEKPTTKKQPKNSE